jgi:hypothetical protein
MSLPPCQRGPPRLAAGVHASLSLPPCRTIAGALVPGGCWFFTVNLLDRRCRLLTDNIDALRAATRLTQTRHPFTIDAMVVLPDHIHAVWTLCLRRSGAMRYAYCALRRYGACFALNGRRRPMNPGTADALRPSDGETCHSGNAMCLIRSSSELE